MTISSRTRRRFAFAVGCALTLGACAIAATAPAKASPASTGSAAAPSTGDPLAKAPAPEYRLPVPSAGSLRMADLAGALIAQGDGAYADTYSDVVLDKAHDQVILYATNTARAAALVRAAARAQPGIRTGMVRIARSAYTGKALAAGI